MIVLVDTDAKLIKLYKDDGVEVYEFSEVDDLADEIGDKYVLYVTSAIESSSADIVDLISKLSGYNIHSDASGLGLDSLNADAKFLQSVSKGTFHIQDVDMTFHGPGDCKPLDEEMIELIQESTVFRALLQQGKIKIINYDEMRKVSRKQQRKQNKSRKLIGSAQDKELDSIIVDSSIPGSAERFASGMFDKDDESAAQEEDITDSIINDPTETMTPEELNKAIQSGNLAP